MIQFYVDDPTNIFQTIPASAIPSGTQWVYNNNFFLLLNLAVGGDWPGKPDSSTPSPSQMLVDYVRVYKAATVPGPTMTAAPMNVTAGGTGTSALNLTLHGWHRQGLSHLLECPDELNVHRHSELRRLHELRYGHHNYQPCHTGAHQLNSTQSPIPMGLPHFRRNALWALADSWSSQTTGGNATGADLTFAACVGCQCLRRR